MKKCELCGKKAKFSQFTPDYGTLYFCSLNHYKKYSDEYMYRASPIQEIETKKEVDEETLNKLKGLVHCPVCGTIVHKSKII
jgi:formate dehydrogenase maturation protein FdhE